MNISIISANTPSQFEACAQIWLNASLVAHDFVNPRFWLDSYPLMLDTYLPQSQVNLALSRDKIIAFSATQENTLAALFVAPEYWRRGIGKLLLQQLQKKHQNLEVTVYQRNTQAVIFYQKLGFIIKQEQKCPHCQAEEFKMFWHTTR